MNRILALLTLLATSCSEAPEPVLAATVAEPVEIPSEVELVLGPGMPEFLEPLEYDALTLESFDAPDDWSQGIEGVSAGVIALLAGLDSGKVESWKGAGEGAGQYSTLYRAPGPRGATFYLYFSKHHTDDPGCFYLFLEDPATEKITDEPMKYCSNWSQYDPPEPRLVDLEGDGVQEIVTMDFFHNGTVLNLTVDYYWEVGADLSLRRVLKLARKDEGTHVDGVGFGTATRRLLRSTDFRKRKQHLVEVVWEPERGGAAELIGGFDLRHNAHSKDWRVGEAHFEQLPEGLVEQLSPMGTHGESL